MPIKTTRKTAPPKVDEPADTVTTEPTETDIPQIADPWASLVTETPKPREFTASVGTPRVDVEKETPNVIKLWVAKTYDAYVANLAALPEDASSNKRNDAVRAAWAVYTFASTELADDFVRLARRYCEKRTDRWTLKLSRDEKTPATVAWLAKPFEARDRKSGETAPVTPAAGEASVPEVVGTP